MSNTNSLNPRQWGLYHLIKGATMRGETLTIKNICEIMPDEYQYSPSEKNYSNCPTIYKDIDVINASFEVEKIIIKNNNNIKIATEEEAIAEATKIQIRALKLLRKYWEIYGKISADGQGKLISCQNKVIDEDSKARPFIEAFKL